MIKYYNNSEVYGQIYDWNKIYKKYLSLNIPLDVWKIRKESLNAKYNVLLSERSIGKTTNVLLLGLCQRYIYNTQIVYLRSNEFEFTPTEAKKLTDVITNYEGGRYIKELTNNKYNTIIYKARAFYYALIDENGNITDRESEECIRVLTLDRHMEYKSVLNMPRGDFFVFDEFIGERYNDGFIRFCDLFKTVARERYSPIIFMLANTINAYSPYFSELGIRKDIRALKVGEYTTVTSEGGTSIYIELCNKPTRATEKRAFFNSLFFGFNNPKLGAITGGNVWATPIVPHIYKRDNTDRPQYYSRNLYMQYEDDFLRLDIVEDKTNGLHIEVIPAKDPGKDAVILTCKIPRSENELYLLGGKKRVIRNIILNLMQEGKIFFATNEEGLIFKNYINTAFELERMPL